MTIWLVIGGGMFTLLLAAISSKKKGICNGYEIVLKGPGNQFFISKNEVELILKKAASGPIKGQPAESFRLHEMEEMLEKNVWISDAELFVDKNDILHATITEKEPRARLFTTTGQSFYIDQEGREMPLSDKVSARVPVFTGYPARALRTGPDSILLAGIRTIASYISKDSFWKAQVAQVDITPDGNFEMIPVIGNHLVKLGDAENIPAKFNRLLVFYREILSKSGFDKYKLIDVQYRGQVVASRYAGDPKVDSIQLRKNVENLLKQSIEAATDTVVKILPQFNSLETDSSAAGETFPAEKTNSTPKPVTGTKEPIKTPGKKETTTTNKDTKKETKKISGPDAEKTAGKTSEERKPKAVMPKKPVEEENGGYN